MTTLSEHNTLRLCKDCKWCEPDSDQPIYGLMDRILDRPRIVDYRGAMCVRIQAQRISPVTGEIEIERSNNFCVTERNTYGTPPNEIDTCGPDAKYFEAK